MAQGHAVRLEQEVERLRVDAGRMDLIERTRTYPFWNIGNWAFRHNGVWHHGPTARAVLDAARAASP